MKQQVVTIPGDIHVKSLEKRIAKTLQTLESTRKQREEIEKDANFLRVKLINTSDGSIFPPIQAEEDLGLFMDKWTIDDKVGKWIHGLDILLEKFMGHRICTNETTAKKILHANNNKKSFTIW